VELDRIIADQTVNRDVVELVSELQARGVAAAKSQNSIDMVSDQTLWQRGFLPEVTESDGHIRPIVGTPWKMTRGAALTDGAPRMGEHTAMCWATFWACRQTSSKNWLMQVLRVSGLAMGAVRTDPGSPCKVL